MTMEIKSNIEISVIRSINKKINSTMKLSELLNSIMDAAKELLHSEGSSILLSDWATGDLIFNVVVGDKGDIILGQKVPKGKGIAGTVAETLEPIIVNDAQNDPRLYKEIDNKSEFVTKNLLAIPMVMMDELVGVLEIVNSIDRDEFNDIDLQKAQYVSDQAALAITNRRLLDESNKRIVELSTLYEVSQAISFASHDEQILQIIVKALTRAMDVKRASILLYDDKLNELRIEAAEGLPLSIEKDYIIDLDNSISGFVFKNGYPMIVADIVEIPEEFRDSNRNYSTESFISIPILYKNNTMGILNVTDKNDNSKFDLDDLRLLTTISTQIAETYNNFLNEKNLEIQKRLAEEIDIAAQIQRKILPHIPKAIQSHNLAAYNKPAKVVGGDFYDFFPFDNSKYGVLMADISGKGIPAALFMGAARNIIRAQSRIHTTPVKLLSDSNNLLYAESELGMFLTAFYAVIDPNNNLITYASAGHNNQILIKKNKKKALKLKTKGTALGVFNNIQFTEKIVLYDPGDILLLFTDGVVEALSDGTLDIEMGEKKLCNIAYKYIHDEPVKLINNLKQKLNSIKLDEDYRDDFTIFVIKF